MDNKWNNSRHYFERTWVFQNKAQMILVILRPGLYSSLSFLHTIKTPQEKSQRHLTWNTTNCMIPQKHLLYQVMKQLLRWTRLSFANLPWFLNSFRYTEYKFSTAFSYWDKKNCLIPLAAYYSYYFLDCWMTGIFVYRNSSHSTKNQNNPTIILTRYQY